MSADGRWRTDTWLDQRLEQLNALYQRFGREGLKEFKDAHLLLWWKQMELRDGQHHGEEKRRLELEVKDLAAYLKERQPEERQAETKQEQTIEHPRKQGRGR